MLTTTLYSETHVHVYTLVRMLDVYEGTSEGKTEKTNTRSLGSGVYITNVKIHGERL